MPNTNTITNTDFQAIELAITAYADERYTFEQKLSSTGIVTGSPEIDVTMESFIGQMRWYKTIDPVFNTPSLSDAADGLYTGISTELASYVKSVTALGSQQVNLQKLVSQEDGLTKMARDFAELRGQREHDGVLSILRGVAGSESNDAGDFTKGIDTFETMPSSTVGMFVDVNAAGAFGSAATGSSDSRKLFDPSQVGAARGERLFRAIGMGFKDYEPDFVYMVTSPEMMADLRAANLIDETPITDGNLTFQTIFGGKFRLILTRAAQGNFAGSAIVNPQSTQTTFLVKPGSIAWVPIPIETPTEVDRNPRAYRGGGTTQIWYRFGYVGHPMGYDWKGNTDRFADNASYRVAANWDRKYEALNLGILPIFHS
jgi:hypothetical protein